MKPSRPALALVVAMTAVSAAHAWKQEPTSVLGVALGESVDSIKLPECPGAIETAADTCLATIPTSAGPPIYRLYGHPFKYATFTLSVDEAKTVTMIKATLRQSDWAKFRDALVERYGKPTSELNGTVQATGGGAFPSATLAWVGSKTSILATERAGTVTGSMVLFTHNASQAAERSKSTDRAKSDASKL